MRLRLLCFAAMMITKPAFAEPIDTTVKLVAQDGKPKTECIRVDKKDRSICEEEITVTLSWLCRIALDLSEDKLPASDIVKRGNLMNKLLINSQVDLSVDEAKLIKDQLVKLNYNTGIKAQALQLIDPQGAKDAK